MWIDLFANSDSIAEISSPKRNKHKVESRAPHAPAVALVSSTAASSLPFRDANFESSLLKSEIAKLKESALVASREKEIALSRQHEVAAVFAFASDELIYWVCC